MPKLNAISGYYNPFKFIKKSHPQKTLLNEQELIEYLNLAYRHAIRKILLKSPASYAEESPIFDLCIDVILNSEDITKVSVKYIEDKINNNKELNRLKALNAEDPDAEKLRLIKTITTAHQNNLLIDKNVVSFVNSSLALEDILDEEYKHGYFAFFGKSDSEKQAVVALKEALMAEPIDLLSHLPTLRKGKLGEAIRVFVKQGLADKLLDNKIVRTVSDFITSLHHQVNHNRALASNPG